MKGPHFSPDRIAAALEQSGGNQSAAARAVGCSERTIRNYIDRYDRVRAASESMAGARAAAGRSALTPNDGSHVPHYSPDRVATALEQSGGNQAAAARIIGCSQRTIRNYIDRYEQVRAACRRVAEARVAAGESGLAPIDGLHGPRFSIQQVAAALDLAHGDKTEAARVIGCSPATINRYVACYEPVREAYRRAFDACAASGQRRPGSAPGGPPRWRYTAQEMAEAVTRARGLASVAARSLGCTNTVVLSYIERCPEVRRAYDEARATMIDIVENKLSEAVDRGDLRAVNFILSMLGADRGYTKKRIPARQRVDEERLAEFEATLKQVLAERGEQYPGDEGDLSDLPT